MGILKTMRCSRFLVTCGVLLAGLVLCVADESPVELGEDTTHRLRAYEEELAATRSPTRSPTNAPTKSPTSPTKAPTNSPPKSPTEAPAAPTKTPTHPANIPLPPSWTAHFPTNKQACSCCNADPHRAARAPNATCFWFECKDTMKDTPEQAASRAAEHKYCWTLKPGSTACTAGMMQGCTTPPKELGGQ